MYNQLFIGLGGTGTLALHEIRKHLYARELQQKALSSETGSGKIGHAFLAIDSVPYRPFEIHDFGENVQLDPIEYCRLNHEKIDTEAPNIKPWLFSRNSTVAAEQQFIFNSSGFGEYGAAQHRRYGRALFAANIEAVRLALFAAMMRLQTTNVEARNDYIINIFCSLAGGTGSGGIVDLVSLIRDMHIPRHFLKLYVFLAGSHNANPEDVAHQDHFFENQYAALRDLNDMATGFYCPHALASGHEASVGKRHRTYNPYDAIIISSTETSRAHILPLREQVMRVAQWVLDSSEMLHDADAPLTRLLTGEDLFYAISAESSAPGFEERAYRFAGLGQATWQLPHQELLSMNMHSIKANSFRQMLYNNLSETEGYLSCATPLTERAKASYSPINTESYMLTESIRQGWNDWYENISAQQSKAKQPSTPLSDMEKAFHDFYTETVSVADSTKGGNLLSLSGRMLSLQNDLKTQLFLATAEETDIASLLYMAITRDLLKDWREGKIGLIQLHEATITALHLAERAIEQLRQTTGQDENVSGELTQHLRSLTDRSDSGYREWGMLKRMSFALKRKRLMREHKDDLVEIYTIRTRQAHLCLVINQLEHYVSMLLDFMKRIQERIREMKEQELFEVDSLRNTNLYRNIYEKLQAIIPLQIQWDYAASEYYAPSAVQYIQHNTTKGTHTIVSNAAELRNIIAEHICNDTPAHEGIGGYRLRHSLLNEQLSKRAYELGVAMQKEADEVCRTNWMGGIVPYINAMNEDDFIGKLRALFEAEELSFKTDSWRFHQDNAIRLSIRDAYIVSFPNGLRFNRDELRALVLRANPSIEPSFLSLYLSEDVSRVQVWRIRFACPACAAETVNFLKIRYDNMKEFRQLKDMFQVHLDDLSAEVGSDLGFPDKKNQAIRREAALWFVNRCAESFTIDQTTGDIVCRGEGNDNQPIYNVNRPHDTDEISLFTSAVQQHLRVVIRENGSVLSRLKENYEKDLLQGEETQRRHFEEMVDSFIKPTLYRIARHEGIDGVFPD